MRLDESELLEVKESVKKIDKFMDKVDWVLDEIKDHLHHASFTLYFVPKIIFWSIVDSAAARRDQLRPIFKTSSRLWKLLDLEEE